jgi:hypothetical protein
VSFAPQPTKNITPTPQPTPTKTNYLWDDFKSAVKETPTPWDTIKTLPEI